ncbi:MAG: hypothetical protein KAT91_04750, partial [Candidatus Aenigmarchaeota archaeon]|nr:hypothetical protein [Candidatus Aenigmarchaeota archaeon]
MQQKIAVAHQKTKADLVFDMIEKEAVGGKLNMISFEKLAILHGVAPNWRKFYLKSLSSQGKIRCDGLFIYIEKAISLCDIT